MSFISLHLGPYYRLMRFLTIENVTVNQVRYRRMEVFRILSCQNLMEGNYCLPIFNCFNTLLTWIIVQFHQAVRICKTQLHNN